MAVKSIRSGRVEARRPHAQLLSLCLLVGVFVSSTPAQDQSLSDQLYAQAKAAVTVNAQNQVLQKIEKLREGELSDALTNYLTGLEAWVLHQRGETVSQQAAEAHARGDAAAGLKLDKQAMEDFHAAIKLNPTRWKSYHQRGVCYALAGDFTQALADFSKTVELNPNYANAWFNRGEILYEMGKYAEAVKDYSQAIRLQPKDAGFCTGRGHAYFQLRRFPSALEDYHQAVALEPNSALHYANRGDAYRSLGRWSEAADDFAKAIGLDRSFGRALQSAAWLMATCPDPAYRNTDLALAAARRAIQLDGESDYIYLDTLAAAQANASEFREAVETLQRAVAAAPTENAAPLQARLALYRAAKPFRQPDTATAQRARNQVERR